MRRRFPGMSTQPAAPPSRVSALLRTPSCACASAATLGLASVVLLSLAARGYPALAAGGARTLASASATATAAPLASPSLPPGAPPGPQVTQYTASASPPTGWRLVAEYPHDPSAFTQGLQWRGSVLYEGTGLNGRSNLRKVHVSPQAYSVDQATQVSLDRKYFGEGITLWNDAGAAYVPASTPPGPARDVVFQLTWKERTAFVYTADGLTRLGQFPYSTSNGEGWGVCTDGARLIVSDGSSNLHFWDPVSQAQVGRVGVRYGGGALEKLNELEYVHGWVLANIWYDDKVAIINPSSGAVSGFLDFSSLKSRLSGQHDVLNGLAYSMAAGLPGTAPVADKPWGGRLWVTGKLWNKMFEVELTQ